MHSAICETYMVQWCSIYLLSIGVGVDVFSVYVHSAICETYLDEMVFHRSIVNWSVGGRCILSICAFCYMWSLFGAMILHRSIIS